MALVRSDPFGEIEQLFQQLWSRPSTVKGSMAAAMVMPMDAWRDGDVFYIELDMPGVNADSIDVDVEENVLVIRAERSPRDLGENAQRVVSERTYGTFSRQVVLRDNLNTEHIVAAYDGGVLNLSIPIAARAKPRRIEVRAAGRGRRQLSAEPEEDRQLNIEPPEF